MGAGKWTRWGRDSCEGYSLSFGDIISGSVVRRDDHWDTSIGTIPLEQKPTKADAMALVEAAIRNRMTFALEEWAVYSARKSSAQRTPSAPKRGNP
jgi:hypothetical protein